MNSKYTPEQLQSMATTIVFAPPELQSKARAVVHAVALATGLSASEVTQRISSIALGLPYNDRCPGPRR